MKALKMLALGSLFGFFLVRAGATDFDAILGMFTLTDLHLMGVIGVAVVVAGAGLWWLRRKGVAGPAGCEIPITAKARKPGNIVGGLMFGAGWALTGTCPGTALAQVGEGTLMGAFTVVGIVIGTGLYRKVGKRFERWLAPQSQRDMAADSGASTVSTAATQT